MYNKMTGPFFDQSTSPVSRRREPRDWESSNTLPDGWGFNAPTNVGKQARKKDRARMEQRAREQEEQDADDGGDWFENPRNVRSRGTIPASRGNEGGNGHGLGKGAAPKITFGASLRDSAKRADAGSGSSSGRSGQQRFGISLLDRLESGDNGRRRTQRSLIDRIGQDHESDELKIRGSARRGNGVGERDHDRSYGDRRRDRDRNSHRDRDRDRDRPEHSRDREREWPEERWSRRGYTGPRYRGGYSR